MVTLTSLGVLAVVAAVLAAGVARLRGLTSTRAWADARAAVAATLVLLVSAELLLALSAGTDAASLALLATPLAATAALRFRGRRSIPRALIGSAVALAAVVVWLTLHLRGPRGGWTVVDAALATVAAAVTIAAAACAGWWTKRARDAAS